MEDKYKIAFNTNFVSSLTGASVAQLNIWDKQGIISPSILKSSGRGSIRLYSFKDIVGVKTVVYLRSNKISIKSIKISIDYLRNVLDYKNPLSELVLVSNGKDVLCQPSKDIDINNICAQWLAANKYGQMVMPFVVPIGAITQTIDAAIVKYNKRIEEAELAEKNNNFITLEELEEKLIGISGKTRKKRAG